MLGSFAAGRRTPRYSFAFTLLSVGQEQDARRDPNTASGTGSRQRAEEMVASGFPPFHCFAVRDRMHQRGRRVRIGALYAPHHTEEEPWGQRLFERHLKMISSYWEAPELLAGAQKMRERERAEQEAKLKRKMRRSQKTQ